MSLSDRIGTHFFSRLVASPRGRAFLFSFMIDAEENDEGGFDELLGQIADPVVQKMVRTHRDDERRHARVLRECLARAGFEEVIVPPQLRYVDCLDRLDRLVGGGFRHGWVTEGAVGVMKIYALLQVLEERGVEKFTLIARALRPVDPSSARVVEEIVADERRHVRYAEAITRRYAPDDATLRRALRESRRIEARACAEHTLRFTRFALQGDLLQLGLLERLGWSALAALTLPPQQRAIRI